MCPPPPLDPEALKARLRPLWNSGRVLRAWLGAEELFPLVIPLQGEAVDRAALEAGCACATDQGYRIEYQGPERQPRCVVFDRPLDLVAFLGEQRALAELARLANSLRQRLPGLDGWIREHPMRVLALTPHWPGLLARLEQRLAAQPGFQDGTERVGQTPDPAQQALLDELLAVLRAAGAGSDQDPGRSP